MLISFLLTVSVLVEVSFCGTPCKRLSILTEIEIDNFVNGFLDCLRIPGLSLAVVHDGEEVLSKGYGKTSLNPLDGPVKDVDSTTLFNIGSTTKAFTGVLLAHMLYQNGSYTWDTPVRDILPSWFSFSDEYREKETTLRDLMAHKMGVPRHDVQWLLDKWSRQELMERMQYFEPVIQYRSYLLYNNLMVTVAAFVAETLAGGESWEDLVNTHLFVPIGMHSSTFMNWAQDHDDFAVPYMGSSTQVPIAWEMYGGTRSVGPASSIASNADDMAKWLKFLLGDNHPSMAHDRVKETFKKEFVFADPYYLKPMAPETMAINDMYARGWMSGYYRGYRVLQHGGDFTGFAAQVHLMPDLDYGSFSAMNYPDNGLQRKLLHTYISDLVLGKEPWFTLADVCSGGPSQMSELRPEHDLRDVISEQVLAPVKYEEEYQFDVLDNSIENELTFTNNEDAPLTDYVGEYGHFAYGNVTIFLNLEGDELEMIYGRNGHFRLVPSLITEDAFRPVGIGSPSNLFALGTLQFGRSDEDNSVQTLSIPAFEPLDPPVFQKDLKQADAPPPSPC